MPQPHHSESLNEDSVGTRIYIIRKSASEIPLCATHCLGAMANCRSVFVEPHETFRKNTHQALRPAGRCHFVTLPAGLEKNSNDLHVQDRVISSRVVGTPALKSRPSRSPDLTPAFRAFHANAPTVPRIRTRPFLPASFQIHYSVTL
jgi:hypothetical protein